MIWRLSLSTSTHSEGTTWDVGITTQPCSEFPRHQGATSNCASLCKIRPGNWKTHILCCCSSNKSRTRSYMPCFPLLPTVVVTTLVNEHWPDSKLSPSLLVRHLERGDTKLQTMPMPLSSLSSSPSSPEDGNCVFSPMERGVLKADLLETADSNPHSHSSLSAISL